MSGEPTPNDPGGMASQLAQASLAIAAGRRGQRLRRGLFVSAFTLAISAAALEGLLRLSDDRERALAEGVNRTLARWVELLRNGVFEEIADPVRRYAMRPAAHCEVDGWVFRVSSHGTRGADFPRTKPPGEKRLVVLGDSFCFGMWCDEEETLAGHLARMASERERELGNDVRWRAINLGVPGYHSGQQLRALEQQGLGLDPDAVVLYFNTNDIDAEGFFFDEELAALYNDHLPLPTWLRRTLWNSHLYGWIVRQHDRSFRTIPSPHLDPRVPWANVRSDNQRATRAALTRIAELCREHDLPLFFVNQPLWTWSGEARDPNWPILPLVRWAEDMRTELGLPGLNLLGLLRGYADGVDHFAGVEHADEAPPANFLTDGYIADKAIETIFRRARGLARDQELEWDRLSYAQQVSYVTRVGAELPGMPDFHLSGDGYAHIARLAYPKLRAAGMLP